MMIITLKKVILALSMALSLYSCAQKTQKQEQMEKEIIAYQSQMYDKIQKFKERPLYMLQVNKNNCRVLVLCNDIPHWITFYENYGESMVLFLNNYIPKSGAQEITVQVFPKEGEEYIAENADVDLKVNYAKDKDDGVNTYTQLAFAELPEDIGSRKLKYYEFKIPFTAKVPFDFSSQLDNAQDLRKIPGIDTKIVAKVNQLRDMLVRGDGLSFLKEIENSDLKTSSYLYATKEELVIDEKNDNTDIKMSRLDVKNRMVHPIENYEIIYTQNGRLAVLRNKKDKSEAIKVDYDIDDKGNKDGAYRHIILYMPKGTNELKVF